MYKRELSRNIFFPSISTSNIFLKHKANIFLKHKALNEKNKKEGGLYVEFLSTQKKKQKNWNIPVFPNFHI